MKKLKLTINGNVNIFDLPENGEYKCEVEESYIPKIGDCVKVECKNLNETSFYWFKVKEVVNAKVDFSLAVGEDLTLAKEGFFNRDNSRIFTQITLEEVKAKYAEAGYDWDYETDTIKPLKWIPKDGDEVWWLTNIFTVSSFIYDSKNNFHKELLLKGLLFPTEEKCKEFYDHCLNFIKK